MLGKGERTILECKKAAREVPKSVWETYSSFANTYGGFIFLGVEEIRDRQSAPKYQILGVESSDKVIKDFWNTVNSDKVSANILTDDDVLPVPTSEGDVVVFRIPRADYTMRPVYINGNPIKGTYKRNYEGDYHCSEQEVRMMIRDAFGDGNDGLILEGYGMEDIDLPTLERYRILFKTDHQDHVWNSLDNKEFLLQIGGYAVNHRDRSEGLTMAGLLMFGKGLPVRDRFDNLRLDYIDKTLLVGDQRYSDRLTYDGTWENNIFNFMQMVLPKLTRDLPRPFQMDGVVRKDDTPQHKAVREAFTNAIIHADFMMNGTLKVEKYDDRLVLTNPGLLKIPAEQIYAGGESKARNQRMQTMLRMIGYGENIGSGFPLILGAWDEKKWKKPELIEQPELMQVKLVLNVSAAQDEPKNEPKNEPKEITERQRLIVNLLASDGLITKEEVSQKTGISLATVKREMDVMKKAGIISREDGTVHGRWVVNE